MIGRVGAVVAFWLVAAACVPGSMLPGAEPVPSGATVVRVTVSGAEVRLDPPVVPAGDVYLMVDEGSISFVQRQAAADATPGPLGDADLARLARGDTLHTAITGLDAGGCSAEQDRQARGMLGPCGNVLRMPLVPGSYAVVAGAPEADPGTGETPPMAVLEVRR